MITDALLEVLDYILNLVYTLLPSWDWHLPDGVFELCNWVSAFNDILPLGESFQCVAGVCTYITALHTYKILMWGIDKIAEIIP